MLLFIIFIIAPMGAVSSNSNFVHCNEVSITGLKLHAAKGITPIKVRFIGSIIGPISKVKYTVTNPTTDIKIYSCISPCPHCTKLGKCICSCRIQTSEFKTLV